ncbi:MAG: hypothetical protein NTX86_02200 [Candidatus Dependentiae bacterium]|nr:hypothetical protein [Candidatus Dependentiae bacterium]
MNKNISQSVSRVLLYGVIIALLPTIGVQAFTGQSSYNPRSQGAQVARDLVGWQTLINQPSEGCFYGAFAITPAYARSFEPKEMAELLLGSCSLPVSGSRVTDRGPRDILADYFGLPSDYKSTLCFKPQIKNFILDLQCYLGLDHICDGLYLRFDLPIVNTTWDLALRECITVKGVASYPAGYLFTDTLTRKNLTEDADDFFIGKEPLPGDIRESLENGRIWGRAVSNGIAELRAVVGWNYAGDHHHAGVNFRVAAPTGTRPSSEFLFEPIIGNGKHWEVGGGVTAHGYLWCNEDAGSSLAVYLDANVVHLARASQKRSFDLVNNGPGSRYMLLEAFADPSHDLFFGPMGPAAPNQYKRCLFPAINKTTLDVKVSFAVQADLALKLSYHYRGLELDCGYNFFGRTAEKLHCRERFPAGLYAVKGDAQVYGFDAITNNPIPLSATQSKATLHGGQGLGNSNYRNLNADSSVVAYDSNGTLNQLQGEFGMIPVTTVQTSNPAVLLSDADIDTRAALVPHAMSHGVFFHAGNVWCVIDNWQPFFGFGGSVEWASGCARKNSTYSQWSLWLKGGVGF